MFVYLPDGSAQSRAKELLASAPTRHQQEAAAVRRYDQIVLAYRVYLAAPPPERVIEAEPRRSFAYRQR